MTKHAYRDFSFLIDARSQTGFRADVLEIIFQKYCGRGTKIPTRKALADLMHHLRHYYPLRDNAHSVRRKRSAATLSRRFNQRILDLADRVNELKKMQQDRFLPGNIIPEENFGPKVTGQIDTFAIPIFRPYGTEDQQRLYYSGTDSDRVLALFAALVSLFSVV